MDLSEKPYKTMIYHEKAITSTDFHHNYPLMGSCSADGTIQVFHSKVSDDIFGQDATVLPLKVLRGHHAKN